MWTGPVFLLSVLGQLALVPAVGLVGPVTDRIIQSQRMDAAHLSLIAAIVIGVPVLVAVAVLFRRTQPWLLNGLAILILILFGNPMPAMFATYSYAAWIPRRGRLAAWTGAIVLAWIVTAFGWPISVADVIRTVVVLMALFVVPLGFGLWVGTRRELIRSLHERAQRLEREQHLLASSAAAEERTRIAREMHDVVAHRVSLMVLHAGGLEVSAPDERTGETAGTIRGAGREALTELRDILGVLRAERAPTETAPQPGLADLDNLVAGWRSAGMRVELSRRDTLDLSSTLQRTAYRVVQEGLTNCAKHAPSSSVEVVLADGTDALVVTVTNGPSPGSEVLPSPTSGYGLGGLGERVSVTGGTLAWGANADGGWTLRAEIPTTSA